MSLHHERPQGAIASATQSTRKNVRIPISSPNGVAPQAPGQEGW